METCERCGAAAVAAGGRCGNCGWQMAPRDVERAASSHSLAATRAIDTPNPAPAAPWIGASNAAGFDRTMDLPMARGASAAQPPRPTRVPGTGPAPAARFCGVCGARITGREAFCGQCGTPIAQATGEYGAAYAPDLGAPSRYHVGAEGGWGEAPGDDLTEAYVPAPMGVSRPGVTGAPFAPGAAARGYSGPSYPSVTGVGRHTADVAAARRTRIVVGLICIAGGLASAAGAAIIAVAH